MAQTVVTSKQKRIQKKIAFYEELLDDLQNLARMMASNDVQSYTIGSRQLNRYKNLDQVLEAIEDTESRLAEAEAELAGTGRRATRAVVMRDW